VFRCESDEEYQSIRRCIYEHVLLGNKLDVNANHPDLHAFRLGFDFAVSHEFTFLDVSIFIRICLTAYSAYRQMFKGRGAKVIGELFEKRFLTSAVMEEHLVFNIRQNNGKSCIEEKFGKAFIRYLSGAGHVLHPNLLEAYGRERLHLLHEHDRRVEGFRTRLFLKHAGGSEFIPATPSWSIEVSYYTLEERSLIRCSSILRTSHPKAIMVERWVSWGLGSLVR
jgi:hypothetical protein